MKTEEEIKDNIQYLRKKYFKRWDTLHFRDCEILHQIDLLEWVLGE